MTTKYNDINIRSARLKKYAKVYNSYIRKIEQSKYKKSTKKTKPKLLNSYQKFVRSESKKDKYKELSGKQRLISIAAKWKTKIN
jgi:hypothetical protein